MTDPAMTDASPDPQTKKPPLGERLKALLPEYGRIALFVYFTIFGLVFLGFWIAIETGVDAESTAGKAGTLAAAYGATKLSQPLRILATLVLTPPVARLVRRKPASTP